MAAVIEFDLSHKQPVKHAKDTKHGEKNTAQYKAVGDNHFYLIKKF